MKIQELIIKKAAKSRISSQEELRQVKRKLAKELNTNFPSNISLLKYYHSLAEKGKIKKSERLEQLFKTRPIRSLSGIVNISVLTKPYHCPGKCVFCPLEPGIPKSYVSGEPAVDRAKMSNFHPYSQVAGRLKALVEQGHPTDKIELRIVGGTWSYYPINYQNWFATECFRACNEFNLKKEIKLKPETRKQYLSITPEKLKKEQVKNEKARHRIIGLSIETRPDYINPKEIKQLRNIGATMIELGVQSIYDDVLDKNIREHTSKATAKATKLLKDAGFKVLYQMMPDLPGSTIKKDIQMFEDLFSNPDFQPDLLKIYPCAVLKDAPLYKLWQKGLYKPYSEKQLIALIRKIKSKIPYYVRIQRVVRDIPAPLIMEGGVKVTNLRQNLKPKQEPFFCRCIRCREVKEKYDGKEKMYLYRQEYDASEGKEIFLSFENKERSKLYSLLRLRIPSPASLKQNQFTALREAAIIREIHTYGQLVPIKKQAKAAQHQGLGRNLVKEAELISKREFKIKKLAVISGIGARNYWRKLGYKLKSTYLVKSI